MNTLASRGYVVENLLRSVAPDAYGRTNGVPARKISIDVRNLGNAYEVEAELPGLRREDIKVSIEGKVVSVSVEYRRQAAAPTPTEDGEESILLHSERAFGKVSRVLQLPVEVDASQAKASYADGLLTLHLPKSVKAAVQELTIN